MGRASPHRSKAEDHSKGAWGILPHTGYINSAYVVVESDESYRKMRCILQKNKL